MNLSFPCQQIIVLIFLINVFHRLQSHQKIGVDGKENSPHWRSRGYHGVDCCDDSNQQVVGRDWYEGLQRWMDAMEAWKDTWEGVEDGCRGGTSKGGMDDTIATEATPKVSKRKKGDQRMRWDEVESWDDVEWTRCSGEDQRWGTSPKRTGSSPQGLRSRETN